MVMRRSILFLGLAACGGLSGGNDWVKQPLTNDDERMKGSNSDPAPRNVHQPTRTIGGAEKRPLQNDPTGGGGRVLGMFRNTYYDFPKESDHSGEPVALMNASCETIAKVPRTFHDAVCVQGSGSLARGGTVSFAKRDCACAEVCPRTGQRICFDALDARTFPFGRGATGKPITPFRTIAADTGVLPMGTVVYIPELDGLQRDESGAALDGCFVVEDRGSRVKGEHVDIFTGSRAVTAFLEQRLPSNQGVTVVVDAPRCAGRR
jgi:3D (Asp-Asp-Asp) domain-containing protein